MITFEHITKAYQGKTIIPPLNLKIETGSFLTIVGTSGSGKTTLLKMINGLVTPDTGSLKIDGKDIQEENLIQLRRKIGYAIQGNVLFPHLTVAENIAYVPRLEGASQVEQDTIVAEKLEMLHLPMDLKGKYPQELSGGQQQRVGIARSLAANPSILLMDEPFGAIDAITRYQLQKELKDLHKKTQMTIIFITHDIAEALKLGDQVLVMDKGQIQQYSSPKEIVQAPQTAFVRELVETAGVNKFV